jgi:beta-barrel assembly-enhancing protease
MQRLAAAILTLSLAAFAGAPAGAQTSSDDQTETKIGQQEYQQLQQKGEIVTSSPYYAILNPIAQQIKRVADPQYFHPFTFILVHESSPNAFAVPGGNVYVTDSLMKFVQNREELAGVLCHETSHDIHHDVLHLYQKQQKAATAYTIGDVLANVLTGGKYSGVIDAAAQYSFTFQTLHFSRDVESAADAKGAITCAQAGSNPWGMVWLFQRFEQIDTNAPPEFISDHPTNQARIAALQNEFRSNVATFGRFSSDIASAHPLAASASTSRVAAARATVYKPATKKAKGMFPPGSGYKF